MIKGIITFHDQDTPRIGVVIGTGEDVKAPRQLAALEKQGWVVDEQFAMTYKAWLAGKRQGDIPADSKFENWVDTVADLDLRPSEKQVKQAVALGTMTQENADALLTLMADDEGEAEAPLG
ncbi:MAG: hypothetical protein Q8M17_10535 [Actinomycetota bacterium]|nr:hypothetical protein [Actinomycetota bacterium]